MVLPQTFLFFACNKTNNIFLAWKPTATYLFLMSTLSVWFGVIFIRMGSYQDGIFKFVMKIPENFPDGDCPVSK